MSRRSILRATQMTITWVVVFALALDTASACRFARAWRASRCYVAPPVYCAPVDSCCRVVVDKCGSEDEKHSPDARKSASDQAADADALPLPDVMDDTPSDTTVDVVPDPPALDAELDSGPTAIESSPNDLSSDPPPPVIVEPSTDAVPADADQPTLDPSDLFDEAPAATTDEGMPTDDSPAAIDVEDLFDGAPEATEETPPTDDAVPDIDDLFDDTSADPTDTEMPAADVSDLFGETTDDPGVLSPATEDLPPADAPPAAIENLDDLFDAPIDDAIAPPTPDSVDPVEGDAAFEAPSDIENLFDAVPDPTSTNEGDESAPESDATDLDDLFSQNRIDSQKSTRTVASKDRRKAMLAGAVMQVSDLGMRQWTDNTGTFHTTARLVEIGENHIRVYKDNGRYSTVPMRRLSERDAAYVLEKASEFATQPISLVVGD